jgi:hypothetical protein
MLLHESYETTSTALDTCKDTANADPNRTVYCAIALLDLLAS